MSRHRVALIIIGIMVFAMGFGLLARFHQDRWPTGDEPNYGIMAQSLLLDGDLDLKKDFQLNRYAGIFTSGAVEPQVNWRYFEATSPHWYSIHSFGTPLLIVPFLYAASLMHTNMQSAAIIGMAFWGALALVAVWLYCRELIRNDWIALAAVVAIGASTSFISLTGNLFPDLPTAGFLALALWGLIRLRKQSPWWLWSLLGISACALLYLHTKNGLMAATIFLLALAEWWRQGRSLKAALAGLAPVIVLATLFVLLIHLWYHTWIVTAPFGNGQLFHFVPGIAAIASLFDSTKGLIINNPAYLLCFIGLPLWWRRSRKTLLTAALVILPSVLIQSTFNDWAGGYSPIGRYYMPAVFAFAPAAAFVVEALKQTWQRIVIAVLVAVQALMAAAYMTKGYQWNYAGEANPLLLTLQNRLGMSFDLHSAIFSYNLAISSLRSELMLGCELVLVLACLGFGWHLAYRQTEPRK